MGRRPVSLCHHWLMTFEGKPVPLRDEALLGELYGE